MQPYSSGWKEFVLLCKLKKAWMRRRWLPAQELGQMSAIAVKTAF